MRHPVPMLTAILNSSSLFFFSDSDIYADFTTISQQPRAGGQFAG